MAAVFTSLAPVFLLILTGTLLRRFVMPADRLWGVLEWLVYYILFPALLIETLARADMGRLPAAGVGASLVMGILVVFGICLALRPLLAAALAVEGPAFTSLVQGATRWNTTLALAVIANLYGDAGLAIASVAAVTMIPLLNVLNVWVLAHFAAPVRASWGYVLLAIARNPFIWSCAIGFAMSVTSPPIPEPIYAAAELLGQTALPLGLLLVGAGLNVGDLIRLRPVTLIATALKLLVMPSMALALGAALGLSGMALAVIACCASVPSASNAYVLARQMGGDAPLMAEILTMQTLVAAATMPIAIWLAGSP